MRKDMGKGHSPGPMETSMKGSGKMKEDMGKVHTSILMGKSMRGSGRMVINGT